MLKKGGKKPCVKSSLSNKTDKPTKTVLLIFLKIKYRISHGIVNQYMKNARKEEDKKTVTTRVFGILAIVTGAHAYRGD